MIDTELIRDIAEKQLAESDLFVVEIKKSPANEIEVVVDSDTSVSIDRCVELSRAIEEALDRDEEDFELTVTSAGIGQPLKLPRQFAKTVGRDVEVLLKSGEKVIARLTAAYPDKITVAYEEKVAVEGKKRKETVAMTREIPLDSVIWTKEHLSFK